MTKTEIKQLLQINISIPFELTNSVFQFIDKENLPRDKEEYLPTGLSLETTIEEVDLSRITFELTEMSKGRITVKKLT